jgi:probable F420-dependent oxidoreductase
LGFRVYATLDQRLPLSRVAGFAQRAEALGYDGLLVPEAVHDGLAGAALALQATRRLEVATGVLVAFPRSPMVVAHAAFDLQEMSGGRFGLGLGSQVKGNVVGRYGVAWAPPVPRMREYVQALRAIFTCWQQGGELRFEGEHYRLTRMQPFFRPDPLPQGTRLPIYLGGIGPGMTALAGEVADALLTHPTNTAPRYLREVLRPRVERGAKRAGRDPSACRIAVGPLVATGASAAELAAERERVRQLLGFLFSTPAYWPSLALFGWQERGERLNALVREGKWADLPRVVDDAMLAALAPAGRYGEIAGVLREWYAGLTDWLTFPLPADPARDAEAARAIRELREE